MMTATPHYMLIDNCTIICPTMNNEERRLRQLETEIERHKDRDRETTVDDSYTHRNRRLGGR